jgi:hypothetical protein
MNHRMHLKLDQVFRHNQGCDCPFPHDPVKPLLEGVDTLLGVFGLAFVICLVALIVGYVQGVVL